MNEIIEYDVTTAAIEEMRNRYMDLTIDGIDDKEGFELVHDARMTVKGHRVAVEKKRKELKADALAWGKKVDKEAKRIFALLEPIETHLHTEESRITEEKQRIKEEEQRLEQERIQARIDELTKFDCNVPFFELAAMTDEEYGHTLSGAITKWEAEQAALAEEQRLEEERKEKERLDREAEEARLAEERAKQEQIAKEQAEKEAAILAEQERIELMAEEYQKELDAKRKAFEDEKRLEAAKKEAAEKALKEQAEAEIREQEEKARYEAMAPDKEKIFGYAVALEAVDMPDVDTDEAEGLLIACYEKLSDLTKWLKKEAQSL